MVIFDQPKLTNSDFFVLDDFFSSLGPKGTLHVLKSLHVFNQTAISFLFMFPTFLFIFLFQIGYALEADGKSCRLLPSKHLGERVEEREK